MRSLLTAITFVTLASSAQATASGALKLDNYTFDKVLAVPGHSFFVKFDQSYAYGEKEDEFKALCKVSHTTKNFLMAEVPVQEYGDKENDDLRERFKLKKDDFPAYFLFNEANKEGKKYDGAIKADDMSTWLRRHKIPVPSIGTIAELDEVVAKFMKDGQSDSHITEATTIVEENYKEVAKAQTYLKIMAKVKAKGEAYVADETKRVTKILEGKLSNEKKAEMNDKLKVLNMFNVKEEL